MWIGKSEKLEQLNSEKDKVLCSFTIEEETKDKFKQYCSRNGYKMNKLIENYMAQVCGL